MIYPSRHYLAVLSASVLALGTGCAQQSMSSDAATDTDDSAATFAGGTSIDPVGPFDVAAFASFDRPWAMTFLPGGERLLVTEKRGTLHWVDVSTGDVSSPISGVPEVDYGGQGGLGDVILHPDFAENGVIYLSYAEAGDGDTRGAAVMRATFTPSADGGSLSDGEVIWRQEPKVTGRGHYGHRLVFSPDGQYLFISSSERQKQEPAQDPSNTLGTIVRLMPDGTVPSDNPMADEPSPTNQIWSWGHRNILGMAFDAEGRLWQHEMGPKGGDEFQHAEAGKNYGWPTRSYGDQYPGEEIPVHTPDDGFEKPDEWWNPVISPAGLIIYDGEMFADWQGDAFIGGLSSQSLIRVTFDCELTGRDVCEAARYNMGKRIREVEQGPDGAIWLLEDGRNDAQGRLLRLTPSG